MTRLTSRVAQLERADSPAGTAIVDGVRMDIAQMVDLSGRRTIAENDRRRAAGLPPLSWRDWPEIDESLTGGLWDRIRAARSRVAAAAAKEA